MLGAARYPTSIFQHDGKRGRFCVQHKLPGMVYVKNKRCGHAGCSKVPSFSYEGEKEGRFCVQHKEQGMMNVNYVVNRKVAECSERRSSCIEGTWDVPTDLGKQEPAAVPAAGSRSLVLIEEANNKDDHTTTMTTVFFV